MDSGPDLFEGACGKVVGKDEPVHPARRLVCYRAGRRREVLG